MPNDPWAEFQDAAVNLAADQWAEFGDAGAPPAAASVSAPAQAPFLERYYDEVMRPPAHVGELFTRPFMPGTMIAGTKGAVKGALNTVAGLGSAVDAAAAGVGLKERDAASFDAVRAETEPENVGESWGRMAEQAGEFVLLPGPQKARVAQAAKAALANATLTKVQGGGDAAAATSAALSVVPVGAALGALGRKARELAPAMVRSGVKPTVAALKRMGGKPGEMLEHRATRLADFILEHELGTPQKAMELMRTAAQATERALSTKNAPTDAAARAVLYLDNLKKAMSRQARPASQVAAIEAAAKEMLEGPMGKDVTKVVGVDDAGNAITEVVREARTDIMADEALELARAGNRYKVGPTSYGMMDRVQKAGELADKEIIRGLRDAAKDAVPEIRGSQALYGRAKEAAGVLDRMTQRQGNRDAVSLPSSILAASGKMILAAASNWLRNNQVKAGFMAKHIAQAIERGDPQKTAFLLHQLGVSLPSALSPSEATRASVSGVVR